MHRLVLASQSPRRRELLALAGYEFEVVPSDKEEIITSTIPSEVVCELSRQKAIAVYESCTESDADGAKSDIIVVGADTVVAVDDHILGKPKDEQEAFDMLSALQGRTHEVYTGVTIVKSAKDINTFYECTRVTFYPMTEEEIRKYIATNDPMDKAGAYGIQSGASVYIKSIEGDYNNVVGLPIARLYHELKTVEAAAMAEDIEKAEQSKLLVW